MQVDIIAVYYGMSVDFTLCSAHSAL